jgi:hypothetical protein
MDWFINIAVTVLYFTSGAFVMMACTVFWVSTGICLIKIVRWIFKRKELH